MISEMDNEDDLQDFTNYVQQFSTKKSMGS